MQAINEMSDILQCMCGRVICFELINKLEEAVDIILDRSNLADAVHFAKEELVLIYVKMSMQSFAKVRPLHGFQLVSH